VHSWKRSEKKNFCACFYSLSKKKEIQTEPEAFYKIEEEKERDDGLLTLFLTPQKKPPFPLKKRDTL